METPTPVAGSEAAPHLEPRGFVSPGRFLGLLGAYFIVQVFIRVLTSPSVDLDESEQVLFAQRVSWGYGPDPPLYTWLQVAFFSVFGTGVLALALMKNTLLFGTYALTYHNTRFVTGSERCAAAAALSLLFIPTIAWESQRDLTHTVLATTMAAASLACFLNLHERGGTRWYFLFALSLGAGLLAKFNFSLWILGLFAAALLDTGLRKALLNWRMAAALVLVLLMVTPYGVWILDHRDTAFRSASKLAVGEASWLKTVLTGLRNLIMAVVSVLGPAALVFAVVFAKSQRREGMPDRALRYAKLILRAVLLVLGTILLLILVFRATGFRERWFQCLLVSVPIAAVALLSTRLDDARMKWLGGIAFTIMVMIACVIPSRIFFGEKLKRDEPLMRPYREVGAQIVAVLPKDAVIVADTSLLGGNLRLALPAHPVAVPRWRPQGQDLRAHPVALVWDARKSTEMPPNLRAWAEALDVSLPQNPDARFFSSTYYHHTSKRLRLGLLLVQSPTRRSVTL